MPELSPIVSAGQDDTSSDPFGSFRRFGLTYLDKNGDQLQFSAGMALDDDKGHLTRSEEAAVHRSEGSDLESDVGDSRPEWPARDVEQRDHWPYPSKTVGEICRTFRNMLTSHTDASVRCSR